MVCVLALLYSHLPLFSMLDVLLTSGWFGGCDGSQFLGFSGLFLQMTDPWSPQAVWMERTLLMQCTGAQEKTNIYNIGASDKGSPIS